MNMINIVDFSTEFIVMCLYSLSLSLALFVLVQVSTRMSSIVYMWRDYWIALIALSALPLMFSILPNYTQEFSVFDFSQLQLVFNETVSTTPLITTTNQLPIQEISTIGVASVFWLCIYLTGLLYALKCLIVNIRLVHSIIKSSKNIIDTKPLINHQSYKHLTRIQKQTKIDVLLSPLAISPFVYQWRKQYLVLPESIIKDSQLSHQEINLIIEHELIHLRNRDQLMVMFSHFIACALWFNPFVKVFQKNMNWAIEAHCDSEVLIQKPHLRKIYAQTMLKILRQSATTTSNHMVAAFSMKTHRSLTMRINNIMKPIHTEVKLKPKKKKLWATALSVGIVMFITQPQSFASPDSEQINMVNPVKQAKVTSKYGANNKFHQFHKGIDLGASIDTPIVAASSGVVRVSTDLLEKRKNYGTLIIIDHDDGFHSVYAHLNSRNVSTGDKVEAGQLIGHVGETGKASGPHLHLELLKDNKHVNPSDYIQF